jgi:arylsulfatase A-like enzyme
VIWPSTPARAIPEMVLASSLAALFLALLDVAQSALSSAVVRVTPGEMFAAALHLVALELPVGLAIGLVLGVALALLRAVPSLGDARRFYGTPSRWLERDPVRFAQPLAMLGALGTVFFVVSRAFVDFTTRYHRMDLAAYAMGGLVLAMFVVAIVVYAALALGLGVLARALGRFASFATLLVLGGAAGAIVLVQLSRSEALEGVDDAVFVAIPIVAGAIVLAVVLARVAVRRTPLGRLVALASAAASLVLVLFIASGSAYGDRSGVRSVVEQRSVVGQRLVRFYAARSDSDHDGYTSLFGGGDCDDTDARVHPGAPDPAGDGIDSDCFLGDGSPNVAPRGDAELSTSPHPVQRPSIVVVTIDALRRDHLGVNGYARPTSPHIDAFAAHAVQFDGVIPSSSRSLRSIPGMWTGLYPSELVWGPEYLWPALRPENATAAEILGANGYASAAVMATDYFQRVDGFFQGFDTIDQFDVYDPPRDRAVDEALPILDRLAGGMQPFLLWIHLFNCHAPYLQDGVASRFGDGEMDRYDTEIALADEQFQRVLDALDAHGLRDHTVVVLASDHGEAFGEHGTFGHSTTLYEEEMRPMLFVEVPGVAPGHVEGNVSLIDVAPTLVDLAGARFAAPISGRSLLPFLLRERMPSADRTVMAELMPDGLNPYDVKVLRRGTLKLLSWVRDGRFQLFDLASDPDERHDLSDERRDEAEQLRGELRAWTAAASLPSNGPGLVEMNRLGTVPRMTTRIDATYPIGFELLGVDLPQRPYHRGESIPLTFFYRVTSEMDQDLFFEVHLTPPPGVALPPHFHADHRPIQSLYPTQDWRAGEILRDATPMVIPRELSAPVHLEITLRVLDNGTAIDAVEGSTTTTIVSLGSVDVVP